MSEQRCPWCDSSDHTTIAGHWRWLQGVMFGKPPSAEDEAQEIQHEAQRLIEHLYDPDAELGWAANGRRISLMRDEAINWGDLHVIEVRPWANGDQVVFEVVIEEAAPEAVGLQEYIAEWLTKWGWAVSVRTEW